MVYDIDMLRNFYANFPRRVDTARERIGGRPMTLAEKILYAHLYDESSTRLFKRGEDYVNFRPDRVAMQDATAQMALLQFMNAGKEKSAVPATVHCDHFSLMLACHCHCGESVYPSNSSLSCGVQIGYVLPTFGFL